MKDRKDQKQTRRNNEKKVAECITKRGNSVRIKVTVRGKTWRMSFTGISITEAKLIRDEKKRELRLKVCGIDAKPSQKSVSDILIARLRSRARKGKISPKTVIRYQEHAKHLTRLLGNFDANLLEVEDVEVYQDKRGVEGAAPKTVNNETQLLVAAFRQAVSRDQIRRNPLDELEPLELPHPSTYVTIYVKEEIDAYVAQAAPWLQRFIIIALDTGCRSGELAMAEIPHIFPDRRMIQFVAENTKGRKSQKKGRFVSLSDEAVAAAIAQIEAAKRAGSKYLFHPATNMAKSRSSWDISEAWRNIRNKIGIPGRVHDLRHTAITWMLEGGMDALVVARIVGHTSARMIEKVYGHHKPTNPLFVEQKAKVFSGRLPRVDSAADKRFSPFSVPTPNEVDLDDQPQNVH